MFSEKLIMLSIFSIFLIVDPHNKLVIGSSGMLFSNNVISPNFQYETIQFIGERILASHCSVFVVIEGGQSQNVITEMGTELLFKVVNSTTPTTTTLISNINSNVTNKNILLKHIPPCNFVVTIMNRVASNFSTSFLKVLTSYNNELTKKDEDYYIFVTPSETVSRLLLGSEIGVQLHFKLVIHPNKNYTPDLGNLTGRKESNLAILMMNTFCIYCPNNTNRIVSLSVSKADHKSEQQLLSQMFPDFTRNMQGYSLRISAPTKYLPTYQMENVNGQYKHKRGIHTLNFNAVAEKINVSYTLQPCTKFGKIPEGASGVYLGNGSWAGCMGDVVKDISDMALSVSPDDTRFEYVRFSSAMEYTYVTFTTSKPGLFFSWTIIFTALTPIVWVFTISSIVVTSTAINLIDHYYHGTSMSDYSMIPKLVQTGMYLMGYIVGQDVPCPKSVASKLIYLYWLAYGFVIGAAYACSLQAIVVSPGLDYIPRTYSELVHSHYKWGAATAFRNGLGEQLFKNSKNRIMRDIYDQMEGDKDTIACTQKALSQYACFNWELMERFVFETQFVDKSGKHPFQMSTEKAFFVSLNFITRKRVPFLSQFNEFFKRSFDSGLVKQTTAMDWRRYRMDMVKTKQGKNIGSSIRKDEGPRSFKFDNVKGAFIVLGCGLVTSGASFSMEKILVHDKRKISLWFN